MNIIDLSSHRKLRQPVVEPPESAEDALLRAARDLFELDWSQITRVTGDAANGDRSDPLAYSPDAQAQVQKVLDHFGFEVLPKTWGELNGVLDYCQTLWLASGVHLPVSQRQGWRQSARMLEGLYNAWRLPAIDAYLAGDTEKLRAIHRAQNTQARAAAEWKEFLYEPGHPFYEASLEAGRNPPLP